MKCGAGQHKLKVYATNGRYIIRNGIIPILKNTITEMCDILNVRGAMNCATTNAFLLMIDDHSEMVLHRNS